MTDHDDWPLQSCLSQQLCSTHINILTQLAHLFYYTAECTGNFRSLYLASVEVWQVGGAKGTTLQAAASAPQRWRALWSLGKQFPEINWRGLFYSKTYWYTPQKLIVALCLETETTDGLYGNMAFYKVSGWVEENMWLMFFHVCWKVCGPSSSSKSNFLRYGKLKMTFEQSKG